MKLSSSTSRSVAICLTTGLLLPLVCLAVPPFHTLGQEFTVLYTVLTGTLFFFLSSRIARCVKQSVAPLCPMTRLRKTLYPVLLMAGATALLTLGVMLAANTLGPQCTIWKGVPYFWITWTPNLLFFCVLGTWLGTKGVRRRVLIGIYSGIGTLSLIYNALQLYWGPRSVPIDFLLGELTVFDQRGGIEASAIHIYQRSILLLFVFSLWNFALWRQGTIETFKDADHLFSKRTAKWKALLSGGVFTGVVVFAGSYVGVGWGKGAIHAALPLVIQTDHFEIRYSDDAYTAGKIDTFTRNAQWSWHQLTHQWNINPKKKIRVYLFN